MTGRSGNADAALRSDRDILGYSRYVVAAAAFFAMATASPPKFRPPVWREALPPSGRPHPRHREA